MPVRIVAIAMLVASTNGTAVHAATFSDWIVMLLYLIGGPLILGFVCPRSPYAVAALFNMGCVASFVVSKWRWYERHSSDPGREMMDDAGILLSLIAFALAAAAVVFVSALVRRVWEKLWPTVLRVVKMRSPATFRGAADASGNASTMKASIIRSPST